MKRLVLWPAYALLPLILIVIVLSAVLLLSPAGVGVALAIADRFLGPSLEVHGWRGTLAGTTCAEVIVYQRDGLVVEAEDACINPNLWTSLDFLRVSIASLEAASVRVTTTEKEADGPPEREVEVPLPIEVTRATIAALEINGLRLDDLHTRVYLDNDDVDSNSTFTQGGRPLTLSTSGPWQRLAVEGSIDVPETINVTGVVDITQALVPYRATLQTQALALGPWIERDLQLFAIRLRLSGDLAGYEYELGGRANDAVLGEAVVRAQGAGDFDGLTLDALVTARPLTDAIGALDGLSLRGALSWKPAFGFDLVAVADAVPLVMNDYHALLSGTIRGNGDADNVELSVEGLTGTANDEPIAGDAAMRWSATPSAEGFDLWIDKATLAIGAGALDIDGQIKNNQLDLNVMTRELPLPFFYPPLGGWVGGSIQLSGALDNPGVEASVRVRELSYEGYSATDAQLDVRGNAGSGDLGFDIGNLDIDLERGDGDPESTPLLSDIDVRGRINYQQVEQAWVIDIGELSAAFEDELAGLVQFGLTAPGRVRYESVAGGVARIELAQTCLRANLALVSGDAAEICGSLTYPEGPLQLRVADLQLVDFTTPINEVGLDAVVGLRVDLETLRPLVGTGELTMKNLIALPDADERIALGSLVATVEISEHAAALTLLTPRDQPLQLDGRVDSILGEDLQTSTLDGRISIDVDGIWAIETFLPMDINYELDNMRGALALDATFGGTVAEPVVGGGLSVKDAGWDVLAVRAAFTDIAIDARLDDAQNMNFRSQGRLGGGAFTLEGNLRDLASDNRELSARVDLEPGRVVDLPDYRADLGGQIAVEMGSQTLRVTGELTMPDALIRIDTLPDTAISVSADAVVMSEGSAPEVAVQQIRTSDVQLTLGKAVRLQAFGLDTLLRGSLRMIERPDLPPDVRGTVTLRKGVFEAYGQELTVERGQLTFVGPVDDPGIDVLASRKVPYGDTEVTVSLLLGGTAKAITTEVRSTPMLAEGDALALLMTGRTLSQMSSQEQTNVYGAAIALGLYGTSGITRNMASTLGLEEIIVEQDNLGEVKVGAAVRLNKDLYLRYTYGVFSRLGGVLLRYRLSNRLSVQGQAGDAQSIEIRYGVDG